MPTGPEDYLKLSDIARILAASERTVRRWVAEGKIPQPVAIAGVKRWRAVEIQQMQEAALIERAQKKDVGRSRPKLAKPGHGAPTPQNPD